MLSLSKYYSNQIGVTNNTNIKKLIYKTKIILKFFDSQLILFLMKITQW